MDVLAKGLEAVNNVGYGLLGTTLLKGASIFKTPSSAGMLAAENGQVLKVAANQNTTPIGSLAQRMNSSANQNAARLFEQRAQATGTGGPAPSFVSRMSKDDSFVPLRSTGSGGLGHTAGTGGASTNKVSGVGGNIPGPTAPKLLWSSWGNYKKTIVDGREYASIGDRFYTRHAVDRMQPSSLGSPAGQIGAGRNISPGMVGSIIKENKFRIETAPNGINRTIYSGGDFEIVTEQAGKIIVTVKRIG
jgi:hypothetical protein